MAIGVEEAVKEAFGSNVEIQHFEQHQPMSVYPPPNPLRAVDRFPHGSARPLRRVLNSKRMRRMMFAGLGPLRFDLAIACGGPNLVPGGFSSPELGLMLHHLNGAFKHRGVPVIDAGVGAAFPLEQHPKVFESEKDRSFYLELLRNTDFTVVRDYTAKTVVEGLGRSCEILPCPAIGSGRFFERHYPSGDQVRDTVLINFQRVGANEDWGQGVNERAWFWTMREVIRQLRSNHKIAMLAHSDTELDLAKQLAPHSEHLRPRSVREYAQVVSRAKGAIVSRVHAAIALAGAGVPSVVVGTDTRLGTVDLIGLPTRYVKNADSGWLVETIEHQLRVRSIESERLLQIRESTVEAYASIFRKVV